MELKFLLFTILVLFAAFGSIESKGKGGRGSSGKGSSSRGSSSSSGWGSSSRGSSSSSSGWGSSSHGSSSSSGWGSSSHSSPSSSWGSSSHSSPSSSWGSSSHSSPSSSWGSSSHGSSSSSGSTGGFLSHERNQGSSSSSSGSRSPYRPFATVPPPTNSGNKYNPFKPFATVPPPTNSGNNRNPFKPFATVPPPKYTDHNNNRPPIKPFATVPPPPKFTGTPKPAPPPPGFILPGSTTHQRPGVTPGNHAGTHGPPLVPTRPGSHNSHNASSGFNLGSNTRPPTGSGSHNNHHNTSSGLNFGSNTRPPTGIHPTAPVHETQYPTNHGVVGGPPPPGFNIGGNTRPPTGGVFPSAPVQTHYPGQQTHPGGSVSGTHYPQQPPFNPAFTNQGSSFYSPYPHQPSYVQTHAQPGQVHPQFVHTLPPNPVQTVVVVPGQSGYQRTTGDIFKEALIHAGVNAAVHRITSPSHYHDHYGSSSWNNNYGTPPQGQSTVTTTNTHIVNNNYYDQNPGGSGNVQGGYNPTPNLNTPNFNTQNYPGGGAQGGSSNGFNTPNSGSYGNFGGSGQYIPQGNSGGSGQYIPQGNSKVPTNGQSQPSQNGGQGQLNNVYTAIWDQELLSITETLFSLDENNATKFISLNLQQQTPANATNITDQSSQPLFFIQPEAYNIPTVRAIRSLYQAASEIENKTRESSRKEEALFVDLLLNTNVMTVAMDFLAQKNLIKSDYYEHKDALKNLWFTPYDGSSSGFKRIFQGEVWQGILWGIQDWVAFDFHEKAGRVNYLSYAQKTDLGKTAPTASILKTNFEMGGNMKTGTALFVGTSPELQMALYTICFYTRPNNYCEVSLGGTRFQIYTHLDRYFGNDLINVAFPIV